MLTLSLWITLDESAKRIQPLRGPREQSSVSTTLTLSTLFLFLSPDSSYIELLLPPDSSSSSPRRKRDRKRPPAIRLESSSSSSYRPNVVLKLIQKFVSRFTSFWRGFFKVSNLPRFIVFTRIASIAKSASGWRRPLSLLTPSEFCYKPMITLRPR